MRTLYLKSKLPSNKVPLKKCSSFILFVYGTGKCCVSRVKCNKRIKTEVKVHNEPMKTAGSYRNLTHDWFRYGFDWLRRQYLASDWSNHFCSGFICINLSQGSLNVRKESKTVSKRTGENTDYGRKRTARKQPLPMS